jgi:hypothetical protein
MISLADYVSSYTSAEYTFLSDVVPFWPICWPMRENLTLCVAAGGRKIRASAVFAVPASGAAESVRRWLARNM